MIDYEYGPGLTPRAGPLPEPGEIERSTAFGRTREDGSYEPGYLQAAFGLENDVVAAFDFISRPRFNEDSDYGPASIAEITKGTKYENWLEPFYEDRSEAETRWRMAQIDKELEYRDVAARGGIGAKLAMMGASAASPTVFVPVAGWAGLSLKAGRIGKVAVGMAEGAVATAAAVGAQEVILQATQETRTASETAWNIGFATVLGGVLGGGLGLLTSRQLDTMADRITDEIMSVDDLANTSAGAADIRMEPGSSKLVSAMGAEKVAARINPKLRTQTSPNPATRDAVRKLVVSNLEIEANRAGIATSAGGSAEAMARSAEGRYVRAIRAAREAYAEHVKALPKASQLSRTEFRDNAIFDALLNNGQAADPSVAKAARAYRELFDFYKNDAIKLNVFPEDVKPLDDPSYVPRSYIQDRVAAYRHAGPDNWMRPDGVLSRGLVKDIADYNENVLIPQIRARLEDLEARTGAVIDDLDSQHLNLSRQELEDVIEEGIENILGYGPNRIMHPADFNTAKRGPLAERTLRVPTSWIKYALETNPEVLAQRYARTMEADLALIRKFGKTASGAVDVEGATAKIAEEGRKLAKAAKTPKARAAATARVEADIRDFQDLVEMVRGTHGMPKNPNGLLATGVRTVKTAQMMSKLGSATITSFSDPVKIVFQHGVMNTMRDAFVPLVTNLTDFKMSIADAKAFGSMADMLSQSRAAALAGMEDTVGRVRGFERGLNVASDLYFKYVSLLTPWTSTWKTLNAAMAQTRALRTIRNLAEGNRVSKADLSWLAMRGVDERSGLVDKIYRQWKAHGGESGGTYWSDILKWTDGDAERAMRALMAEEDASVIVSPTAGDLPTMATDQQGKLGLFGPLAFQFKSFAFASVEKTMLSGLQRHDAAVFNGTMLMLALGAMSYAATAKMRGEDLSEVTPQQWVAEAVDRSGIMGPLMDVNAFAEKATRGRVGLTALTGEQLSRYRSRGASGALLGPSADMVEDIVTLMGSASTGDWTSSDTHRVRKMMPLQNVFYLRQLFDAVERGANGAMGVPDTRQ